MQSKPIPPLSPTLSSRIAATVFTGKVAALPNNIFSTSYLRRQHRHLQIGQHQRPLQAIHPAVEHLTSLTHFPILAFAPPPACFDAACQAEKDKIFSTVMALPLVVFIGTLIYLLRQPKPENPENQLFDSPDTGVYFEGPNDIQPERDAKGELAYKAVSYTPWPVPEGEEGERIRIPVGPIPASDLRTFVFQKTLNRRGGGQFASRIFSITLPRPLGLIFEEDVKNKRVVLGEIVEGSYADQLVKKSALDPSLSAAAPAVGDVLRAVTSINIVYPTGALLFGAKQPERQVVVYGCDGQRWPQVASALKRGFASDGEVTLVLERAIGDQMW